MKPRNFNRRKFFTLLSAGSAALAVKPLMGLASEKEQAKPKPATNIKNAVKAPGKPETMPYMINTGKYSYYTKIVTQEVDKIINITILKNAGGSITNAMKNLAFRVISNTGRLHAQLWNDTCAEVCAFAPVRDKVVLNIIDGLRGCFNGGPGANPQFICNYNTLLAGSNPVAMDRIAYDIIADKRIAEGVIKAPIPAVLTFLKMADDLGLGIQDKEKIEFKTFDLT